MAFDTCPSLEEMHPVTRVKLVAYLSLGLIILVWVASCLAIWTGNKVDASAEQRLIISAVIFCVWIFLGIVWAAFFGCRRTDQVVMTGTISVIIDDMDPSDESETSAFILDSSH